MLIFSILCIYLSFSIFIPFAIKKKSITSISYTYVRCPN